MALVATAYYTRRSCRGSSGNVLRRDTRPVDDPPEQRRGEPSMASRERAPVPVALAGYDRARTSTYDWSWRSSCG